MSGVGKANRPAWQQDMIYMTVLYRILECDDRLHVVDVGEAHRFIENELAQMHAHELIETGAGESWQVTAKGEAFRDKMVAMYDQLLKFEIFGSVDLTRQLTTDEGNPDEDSGAVLQVFDDIHDPRFRPSPNARDMRLAMMTFLGERLTEAGEIPGAVNRHRLVFLQKLADGELRADEFWLAMYGGRFFRQIEEIVESHYTWQDVADEPDDAAWVMEQIYTAGMLEQRKREGHECSACNAPLAVFEANAAENSETLSQCPVCDASFAPPAPPPGEAEYECPNCGADVHAGQRNCRSCGAVIDFGLAAGTVVEETVEETYVEESYGYGPAWGGHYGYQPYGWYDPYDPFYDAVAFGVLCAVVF